jgi:gamma-aminobutyric acid type B receptor
MNVARLLVVIGIAAVYASEVQEDLCLVVLGPYPDKAATTTFQPDWNGGPALIPASRLAVDKINNRTDILSGYRLCLLEGDSGCDIESKAAVSLVQNAFHLASCPVVGVIGPGCTGAAALVGNLVARDVTSLLHISPSATSPLLTDSSVYPNTFRMLSSSLEYISMYRELIQHNRWDNIAALYDANRKYFLSTFDEFRDVINVSYSSPVSDSRIPLEDIYAHYKVVFVFVGQKLARNILCLAYHFNPALNYPIYQWIFHDKTENQFWQDVTFSLSDTSYSCSRQQMMVATEGIVLNLYRLQREDVLSETDVDFTLSDFYVSYQLQLSQYLSEANLTQDQYVEDAEDYALLYYDATWAMALALNRSELNLMRLENMTLSEYYRGNPRATALINHQLRLLEFEGLSGRVMFRNETHDAATIIDIYQVKYNRSTASSGTVLIGYYNDNILELTDSADFVPSSFKMVQESVHPVVSVVFFSLILLCIAGVAIQHILFVYYRNTSSIKAASPRLSQLTFSGCYLVMFLALILVLVTSKWVIQLFEPMSSEHLIVYGVFCNVASWNISAGYILILGSLLAHFWRIYNIFNHMQKEHHFLSDKYLVCFVAGLVALNSTVHLVWISSDPRLAILTPLDVVRFHNGYQQPVIPLRFICYSGSTKVFNGISIGISVCASIGLAVLSILNRHVRKKNFNITSGVNVHVFVSTIIALFSGIVVSTLGSGSIHYVVILWELCFLFSVFIVSVFLFLPRVRSALAQKSVQCTAE